jgi:TolB-like protein
MRINTYHLIILFLFESFLFTAPALAFDGTEKSSQPHYIIKVTDTISPRSERSGLAVLKFANSTSKERSDYYQPWEYGIAAMLTTDLEETSMFNIVDRERLNDVLKEHKLQQAGLVDPKSAVTIGRLTAARYILSGTFIVVGRDLKITVQVFCVEKGILLGATSATGKTEKFFVVQKELFTKVTKVLKVILDDEKKAKIMNTVETKSVDASLKNYSGEIALMKADESKKMGNKEESAKLQKQAKQDFKEALEYDPNYERAKKNLSKLVMAIPMTL